MSETPEISSGQNFKLHAPATLTIDEIREQARQQHKREIHIKHRLGPTTYAEDGTAIDCPIEVVDDQVLQGGFQVAFPSPGYVLYFGYFK